MERVSEFIGEENIKMKSLKIYYLVFIFLIINASIQTNVSAMNEENKKDMVKNSIINSSLNFENKNEEKGQVVVGKNTQKKEEGDENLYEAGESSGVEGTSLVNQDIKGLEVDLNLSGTDDDSEIEGESQEDQIKQVAEVDSNEDDEFTFVEDGDPMLENDEDNLLEEEDQTVEIKEESLFSEEEIEEEITVIDEEEFSPIIGLPSVKEEVEIEYEEKSEKESKKIVKKKMITSEVKKIEKLKFAPSSVAPQKMKMKELPQTSGDFSDLSEIGYLVIVTASAFILIRKK